MPRRKITFDTVREIGLALPEVEEGTTYGTPALKVHGNWLACVPSHRSAEPDSLAVRIEPAQRDELIAAQPDVYYVKDHYIGYPVVLVRLARVHPDALGDLLLMAWRLASRSRTRRPSARVAPPRRRLPRRIKR